MISVYIHAPMKTAPGHRALSHWWLHHSLTAHAEKLAQTTYYRIFNPMLQSQRFDPQHHYIRE